MPLPEGHRPYAGMMRLDDFLKTTSSTALAAVSSSFIRQIDAHTGATANMIECLYRHQPEVAFLLHWKRSANNHRYSIDRSQIFVK
jgi:hypothetical protein